MKPLEEAVLGWRKAASKGQEGQPEWFHPLRSLVQAGIPMVCQPLLRHSMCVMLKASQQLHPGTQGAQISHMQSCAQAYRGQLWRCFLNVEEKAQEGVYDRLVSKALGKHFSSKVLLMRPLC